MTPRRHSDCCPQWGMHAGCHYGQLGSEQQWQQGKTDNPGWKWAERRHGGNWHPERREVSCCCCWWCWCLPSWLLSPGCCCWWRCHGKLWRWPQWPPWSCHLLGWGGCPSPEMSPCPWQLTHLGCSCSSASHPEVVVSLFLGCGQSAQLWETQVLDTAQLSLIMKMWTFFLHKT